MNIKILFLLLGGGLWIGCSSSQNTSTSTTKSKLLDDLVAQKSFQIESDQANPLVSGSLNTIANSGLIPPGSTVGTINLIGNPNYFKVKGDSITMYLPYYGEQQMAGAYNNRDVGIEFNGVPYRVEITKNERRNTYKLNYHIRNNTEVYKVFVTLFPNLTSTIRINSNQRTPIGYKGRVSKLSEKKYTSITNQ